MDNDEKQKDYIQIQLPDISFNERDVTWEQRGYEIIGTASSGVRFGVKIDRNLRMVGIDENNKPIFKRINK